MTRFKADKTFAVLAASAICALALTACKSSSAGSNSAANSLPGSSQTAGDYFGEDWAAAGTRASGTPALRAGSTPGSESPASIWTLVLATFTDANHFRDAQNMLAQLPAVAPQVSAARIHTSPKGSMVIYGQYKGRDDPAALADERRLKSITHQNRQVFSRVILTHLDLRLAQSQLHPHDLLSARRAHPKVEPLYTLDVAIWDDFGSGKLSPADIRRAAETYAAQLRARGFEAYFYHSDSNPRSMVTVGLFDRRAIHPTSGLYSADVTDLIKQFPVRLANGEPVHEFINRFRPNLGTKPQTPVLVLVPSM